ncbi:MAG: glycosyltransferase [Candidatus Delongbacteria bacterium]|nr:glycosyltransferase [Candidatus Delongbacteria bacterium]
MVVSMIVIGISLGLWMVCIVLIMSYPVNRAVEVCVESELPMVSILKPVKNWEAGLVENLKSFFELDYPRYELIFGLDEPDPAIENPIRDLVSHFPQVEVKIVMTGREKIQNPKIDTMIKLEPYCRGDLYWISDSNTRVDPGFLSMAVRTQTQTGSGLVFFLIRGSGTGRLGSLVENLYLNSFVSGTIVAAWHLAGIPIVVGKSILIDRKALDRCGGWPAFRPYLAEDYMMGAIFRKNRIKVTTNYHWVVNTNHHSTLKGFFSRISRWSTMRFAINPWSFGLEILLNPIWLAVILIPWLGWWSGAVIMIKIVLDGVVYLGLSRENRTFSRIVLLPLVTCIKDGLIFIAYLKAMVDRRVDWRGRKLRVGRYSVIIS